MPATYVEPLVPAETKGLFASMETSGDISGDWLQLEKSTFKDLKNCKKIRLDITWEQIQGHPEVYDEVAKTYINDLMTTFGIPTVREAALWSWRPAWYKKYGGRIENIPPQTKGVFGKSAREVMESRLRNLVGG